MTSYNMKNKTKQNKQKNKKTNKQKNRLYQHLLVPSLFVDFDEIDVP